jgi:hypothetical protein
VGGECGERPTVARRKFVQYIYRYRFYQAHSVLAGVCSNHWLVCSNHWLVVFQSLVGVFQSLVGHSCVSSLPLSSGCCLFGGLS